MNHLQYGSGKGKTAEALNALLTGITGPDREAMSAARQRQETLAKPPGSLGRLEELSVRMAGMTGRVCNQTEKKALLVFCADNGVVSEGVSGTPQSVTLAQTINLAHGKTGAAVLAGQFGCEMRVCDVGVNAEISDPAVIPRKIAYGTENIAKGPAMTYEQALQAILTGAELAAQTAKDGVKIIGVGEMGIGNTTTAAAVLSALTGSPAKDIAGRGSGLTDAAYAKKISVIEEAILRNRPDPLNPVDVLAKVGGLDIAAMCGAFLGAAKSRVPVVTDGFISAVAALCAVRLCPNAGNYMISSHASFEKGFRIAAKALQLSPLLDLNMRLGEGSGCPLAMMLVDAANAVMNHMATFDEAAIDDGYLEPLRRIDAFTTEEKTQ